MLCLNCPSLHFFIDHTLLSFTVYAILLMTVHALLPLQVSIVIKADQMMLWGDSGQWEVTYGTLQVDVGGQQPMQSTTVDSNILTGTFTISP